MLAGFLVFAGIGSALAPRLGRALQRRGVGMSNGGLIAAVQVAVIGIGAIALLSALFIPFSSLVLDVTYTYTVRTVALGGAILGVVSGGEALLQRARSRREPRLAGLYPLEREERRPDPSDAPDRRDCRGR